MKRAMPRTVGTAVERVADTSFYILAWGLVYTSVCTSLSDEAATQRVNRELPTGIASRWAISEDKAFATGEAHPHDCTQQPGNRHLLFSC